MVPKNTLQRTQSWGEDRRCGVFTVDLGSGLDLVPTKEKSLMRTTVMGGLDQRRSRWRNLSRDEWRGSKSPAVVVEEGRIMVVEEFTYSAAGRTSRD
jgi:hypothetical protein